MGPRACILEGMENLTQKGIKMNKTINAILDNEWVVMIGSGVIMAALVTQFIIVSTN